jgi:hypothetical protein
MRQRGVMQPSGTEASGIGGATVSGSGSRPVARLILAGLTLAVIAGWSGLVDMSGWPVSVPVVLEHCSVRYQGANVSVYMQGPGAHQACDGATAGWQRFTGPPLGGLACYRQSHFGLSWKVYDTGFMLLASQVCDRLHAGASSPAGYQAPDTYQPQSEPRAIATLTPRPSPTRTASPEERSRRLAQERIDAQASQVIGLLSDLESTLADYGSMIEDMEGGLAEARAALRELKAEYRENFSEEIAIRPMTDNQRYVVWSSLADMELLFHDVELASESVSWSDNPVYRRDVVDMIDHVAAGIGRLETLHAGHIGLRFTITATTAESRLERMSARLVDLDARHQLVVRTASEINDEGRRLWDKATREAEKVSVDY